MDEVIYPTVREAMAAASAGAKREGGTVWVCRASRVGCDGKRPACPDCYQISPHDRRPIDDHVRQFLGGDA